MTEYWYCLTHERVEGKDGCRNADRLGPYASESEAARAKEIAAERTEAWDQDPDWNDDWGKGSAADQQGED